jgi:hypothetical protein
MGHNERHNEQSNKMGQRTGPSDINPKARPPLMARGRLTLRTSEAQGQPNQHIPPQQRMNDRRAAGVVTRGGLSQRRRVMKRGGVAAQRSAATMEQGPLGDAMNQARQTNATRTGYICSC